MRDGKRERESRKDGEGRKKVKEKRKRENKRDARREEEEKERMSSSLGRYFGNGFRGQSPQTARQIPRDLCHQRLGHI